MKYAVTKYSVTLLLFASSIVLATACDTSLTSSQVSGVQTTNALSPSLQASTTDPATKKFSSVKKRYIELIEIWSKRVEQDPYDHPSLKKLARARYNLARATGDESQFELAEIALKKAIAVNPKEDVVAKNMLAELIMAEHGFTEALEITDELIKKHPAEPALLSNRADALVGLGHYLKAQAILEQLVEQQPSFDSWTRLAHVYSIVGKRTEAKKLLLKARDSYDGYDPEPAAWIRLRLGIHHLQVLELSEAETYFRQSLKVAPDYYLAQEHLAEVHEIRKEFKDAEPYLVQAIATKNDPALQLRLAGVLLELGRADEASTLKEEAIKQLESLDKAKHLGHLRDIAEAKLDGVLRGEKALAEALELAKQDHKIRPGDLGANFVLAKAYRANGDLVNAKKYIDQALRFNTPNGDYVDEAKRIAKELSAKK